MVSLKRKPNIKVGRVAAKIAGTLVALYAGGTVITELGEAMRCTHSPFYQGLSLLGWTIEDNVVVNASHSTVGACNTTTALNGVSAGTYNNLISDAQGSGILAIVGIIGLASIVMEFVTLKF